MWRVSSQNSTVASDRPQLRLGDTDNRADLIPKDLPLGPTARRERYISRDCGKNCGVRCVAW
jgi:hypothetical protein